ncbi:MAG: hypothetical protein J1G38_02935 [Clostridiales bacterium]|nr:hypothetical protein [Clostridiales bacterium]
MASILDKIKNFFYVSKIKSGEKEFGNVDSIFESNLKCVVEKTYSVQLSEYYKASIRPEQAARYCVKHCSDGKPFYVLTCGRDYLGHIKNKQAKEITAIVSAQLKAYSESGQSKGKAYYNAAAAVLAEIEKTIKDVTLIGFTCDKSMAYDFETFKYSQDMTDDELTAAWGKVGGSERLYIISEILGNKKNIVPQSIRVFLAENNRLFDTIYWKIVKHQLQLDDPIDEKVFKMIKDYSEIRAALADGYNIHGLNFGQQIQFATLKMALTLGSSYVDELRAVDGWLSVPEMEFKINEYEEIMKEKHITSAMTPTMQQEASQRKQEALLKQQIEAQKATARAPLQAQLAQMRAQIKILEGRRWDTRNTPEGLDNERQIRELQKQCSDLEWQLRNI